jgi:hypothetical protein
MSQCGVNCPDFPERSGEISLKLNSDLPAGQQNSRGAFRHKAPPHATLRAALVEVNPVSFRQKVASLAPSGFAWSALWPTVPASARGICLVDSGSTGPPLCSAVSGICPINKLGRG